MPAVKRYQKVIYSFILAFCLIWCAAIIIAPLWHNEAGFAGSVSEYSYSFFSRSCHQIDERSLHLAGNKLGVCSRCTSIYFAFLLGVIIYPFIRKLNNIDLPPLIWLGIGAGLVAIDAGLDLFDIIKNTYITREISGAALGLVLPFYIIPGIIRIFYEFFLPPNVMPEKNRIRENKFKD
jgi:uncharacterized membrane protein